MRRLLFLAATSFLSFGVLFAETASELAERFAVADDREAVVASLVPGTQDFFHYRCLLWQHQGKLAEVDVALASWEARFGDSPMLQHIRLRQALLLFGVDPKRGSEGLTQVLEVNFDTSSQVGAGVAGASGAVANQPVPVAQRLTWEAIASAGGTIAGLKGWSDAGIERIIADVKDGDQRRLALARLPAHHPDAVALVVADLAHPGGDFGSLPIHRWLTLSQLDACRKARPEIAGDDDFILTYLRATWAAREHALPENDLIAQSAWIAELSAFVDGLPASAAPLRMYLDLHRLRLDVARGQVDAAWLATVVARPLPPDAVRRSPRSAIISTSGFPSKEQMDATHLGNVGSATALVHDALEMVLANEVDTKRFDGVVEVDDLHRTFITAKLLNGVGDPAQWLANAEDSVLGTQVRDQVELRFGRNRSLSFGGDDAVALPLELKNVPTVLVRIFALDPLNVGRHTKGQSMAWMDLTGVMPTAHKLLTFNQSPIVRHASLLALPECVGPGWWIIDVVGGGQVARAVVQKGALRYRRETRRDGEHLFVSDEADRPVADAVVWLDDQRFTAGADGSVRVPFAQDRRQAQAIITGSKRALVTPYQTQSESWRLTAAVLLDGEQVIAGTTATMLLRPCLELCGTTMAFANLHDVAVEVTTRTGAGSQLLTRITTVADPDQAETVITFPVPDDVRHVEVVMRGHLRNQAAEVEEALEWRKSYSFNDDHATERIRDMQLEREPQGWFMACRGLNGEALGDVELALRLQHRLLAEPLDVRVVTGADGRAALGDLTDITDVSVDRGRVRMSIGEDIKAQRSDRRRFEQLQPSEIPRYLTAAVGDVIRLPISWVSPIGAARDWQIVRSDEFAAVKDVTDQSKRVAIGDAAVIVIADLPAGSYWITTPAGSINLHVLDGQRRAGVIFTKDAIVRGELPTPLGVQAQRTAQGISIQVLNPTPTTRVQVIGRRFHAPDPNAWFWWPEAKTTQSSVWPRVSYMDGRPLDEEVRYILDRAQADHHPGVMLERPGLVLNPWHDDSFMAIGAGGGSSGMFGNRDGGGKRKATSMGGGSEASEGSHRMMVDFLAGPGVVLANLSVDKDGLVQVSSAQLGDAKEAVVIACDALSAVTTTVALPATPLHLRDRRLVQGLPVAEHLVYERTTQVIAPATALVPGTGALHRQRLIASVGDLFALYRSLAPDARLSDFVPLAQWPTLSEKDRRDFYGRFASHELNLFLWHKDRPFFVAVVRPHLLNKLQKTFIDRWLLEEDLSEYLAPDRHQRLNMCERVLLARRMGGEFLEQERKNLAMRFADLEDDERHRFDQATQNGLAGVSAAKLSEMVELPPMKVVMSLPDAGESKQTLAQDAERNIEADASVRVAPQFFKDQPGTTGYIEQNWLEVPWDQQREHLIDGSAFWRDLLHWDGVTPFLSRNCLLATTSRSEVLVALALSDVPFSVVETNAKGQPRALATAALLLREEAVPAPLMDGEILVHQHLYLVSQFNGRGVRGEPVHGDLHPDTPYVAFTVAVNASLETRGMSIVAQIPTGAVPILNSSQTVGRTESVPPYAQANVMQAFYFPSPGVVQQYPAHVRSGATVVAAHAPVTWTVSPLGPEDTVEWYRISDDKRLLAYLDTAEADLDLSPITWRLRDRSFWEAVVTRLERRKIFAREVWSFAVFHGDLPRTASWIRSQTDVITKLGNTFTSRWITLAALEDGGFIHADLTPVTNGRAHLYHGSGYAPNALVTGGHDVLVQRLCLEPQLSATSYLELAYSYMLQDRTREASVQYQRIDAKQAPARMAYDYLGAYLALARGDVSAAITSATPWKDHAVERWRLRFGEVLAQAEEIAGRPGQREPALVQAHRQSAQAAASASFQAKLSDPITISITANNLAACTVRFHRMDLESLFSRTPFAMNAPERLLLVRPEIEVTVAIAADGTAQVRVPEALRHQPLAIQISGAGQQQVLTNYADALDVRLTSASGQLQVFDARNGTPLTATYIKVYAKRENGETFHKDGYTDLRGRFDYVTLGDHATVGVTRFALFIQHPDAGSTVREVSPP